MVMHDLVRSKPMGDVDIFVATRAWFDLYQEYVEYNPFKEKDRWNLFTTDPNDFKRRCDPPYLFFDAYGIEVNIFCEWRKRGIGDLDVNWLILNAKDVEGIPCYSLQFCLDWKREVGRAKDLDDIRILEQYQAAGGF